MASSLMVSLPSTMQPAACKRAATVASVFHALSASSSSALFDGANAAVGEVLGDALGDAGGGHAPVRPDQAYPAAAQLVLAENQS